MRIVVAIAMVTFVFGCTSGPKDVRYGLERCAHCMMVIDDDRFVAQLVTSKGKVFSFDAVECLARYNTDDSQHSRWVWSRLDGGAWKRAEESRYVHNESVRSPMGGNVVLIDNTDATEQVLTWEEMKELVQ